MTSPQAISLSQLTRRIATAISVAPGVNDVWVTGETSDLRVSRGHCYLDLIEKNGDGEQLAKMRATIWARDLARISAGFKAVTGADLRSDMKIMARVRTNFHPVFGLSLNILDINPEFTVGDMIRRRNEILDRLKREGLYDLNRKLPWPSPTLRVAVVSAAGAAGYGDFIRQLYSTPVPFKFTVELFEAPMQGAYVSSGVMEALDKIAARAGDFDCAVIIRGGGAVAELVAFDDYMLAAACARFPLPLIVGIGHDRDTCVLDYIAARSARTPTAAAEFLVSMADAHLSRLRDLTRDIAAAAAERIRRTDALLARYSGELPLLARGVITKARMRVSPEVAQRISDLALNQIARRRERLKSIAETLDAISPEATLRRGFSITRHNGHAIISVDDIPPGSILETTLASATIHSVLTLNPENKS